MKYVPVAITKKVARAALKAEKNSPTLLFAAGITGMVTATVLACKATLRVDEVLEKTQTDLMHVNEMIESKHQLYLEGGPDYSTKDAQRDKAYIYVRSTVALGRLYGPSIVLGVISIGCLGKAHNILTKRNAALVVAYSALERSFKDYRDRVIDEVGEDREREIFYDAEIRQIEDDKGKKQIVAKPGPNGSSIYARFFDELSPNWSKTPEFNMLFLKCQQDYANDMLRARGHVLLNDVYDTLGIERSSAGTVVGWVINKDDSGDNFIDFGLFNGDNPRARDFVNGREGAILLDFNVDGVIYDKI